MASNGKQVQASAFVEPDGLRVEMTTHPLDTLAMLMKHERGALLSRWQEQVRQLPSAQNFDTPTLNDHVPGLVDELAAALKSRSDETIPEALLESSPLVHGSQRLQDGFDIEEVVAEYNILRECIHDLADSHGLSLQGMPFHIINRVLGHAIGLAVQTYATQKALEVQKRREEYLAFVAHDLRTPLNAISLVTMVLEQELSDKDKSARITQMFRTLRRNVAHLSALVSKVLEENANLQTETGIKLERRDIDLWPLVEALIHDLHPVAGTASTHLINRVSEDLVVHADASLLRRVIQNLIANAIRYTPRGEVTIGARENSAENVVECWVSDNGAGIPEQRLDKVFEPFETDPEKEGGLGLGLSIVKTFVEAHGGEVSVKSTDGCGSTFRFTLPKKP
jgi:two-component system, OmpR family, phosphate regulon sensor histidine kinase PhoR